MAGSPAAQYIEEQLLPLVLSGLEETLQVAKKTERRKQFNPLDHLAEYLYRHNPRCKGREDTAFEDIPFVKEEWTKNPREPLPLSATLTETEAATIIQSHYRAFVVRKQSEPRLFRDWQRRVEGERKAVQKIQGYWRRNSSGTIAPVIVAAKNETSTLSVLQESSTEH